MRLYRIHIVLFLLMVFHTVAFAQKKKQHHKKQPLKRHVKAVKKSNENKLPVKQHAKDSSDLKSTTIEIIQSYQPEVRIDAKKESAPLLPPADTTTASVKYVVEPQSLNYGYFAIPLRPLSLSKDSSHRTYRNYIKIGGGNLSSLLLDAGIIPYSDKQYESVINIHHLSQTGKITDQKTTLTAIEAGGRYVTDKHIWKAGVYAGRNEYGYYGFNDIIPAIPGLQAPQVYTRVGLDADMRQTDEDAKLSYNPSIHISRFSEKYAVVSELTTGLSLPFSFKLNQYWHLLAGLSGKYIALNATFPMTENYLATLHAGGEYRNNGLTVRALVKPTLGIVDFYFLPDVTAQYNIAKSRFTVLAGWQGKVQPNTVSDLTNINPYLLLYPYSIAQTHRDEIFGGVQTNVGEHVSVTGKVIWAQSDNMPLFLNDTLFNKRYFEVIYDNVKSLSIYGSLRYQIGDKLAIGGAITYTSFNTAIQRRAWHEPGVKLNADILYRPISKLVVTADMAFADEIYALDVANKVVKLNPMMDIGCRIRYHIPS